MKQERYQKENFFRRLVFRLFMLIGFIAAVIVCILWVNPLPDNNEITKRLKDVGDYDILFNDQKNLVNDINYVVTEINALQSNTKEEQRKFAILEWIDQIKMHKGTLQNSRLKSKYNLEAVKFLKMFYESRSQLHAEEINRDLLEEQLEECLLNVPQGALSAARI